MAITITDQPTNFAKVGQKLMVVATSTNVAQPNFRYVVRVTNVVLSETSEMIVPPNPQNRLMFDLAQIVKQWCYPKEGVSSYEFIFPDSNPVVTQGLKLLPKIDVEVLEGYDVAAVFTVDEGSAVSLSTKMIMTASYKIIDGYKPDPNSVYSLTGNTSLLMGSRNPNTNYPSNLAGATPSSQRVFIPVRKSELDWGSLSFILQHTDDSFLTTVENPVLRMTLYESDGTPNIATQTLTGTSGLAQVAFIGVYPKILNDYSELLRPADFPNWRWYDIALYDSTNTTRKSAQYTFYPVDDDCTFDNVRLAWWDDVVGGFDFFNFQRKNEITMEVERKRIKPVIGTYDAATFSFNTFDAEIKEGMIDAVDYIEVTSGWIQEGEFELLKHLVKSEMVYICQDSGQLVPVVMETNSFTVNKERNAKLKSVSFRLRIAQQNIQ
jgi:hypothetical protein